MALALLFVFAGCEQADYTLKAAKLSAPGKLKATVEQGAIILTWNPVNEASGYKIVRKDTVDGLTKVLIANTTNHYYIDCVGWDNQLADARSYEYSVISLSGVEIMQNGAANVKATANIPQTLTITLDKVDTDTYTDNGSEMVLVKFTSKPNYAYRISYTYGTAAIVRDFETFGNLPNSKGGTILDPVKTTTFPAIGGDNSVTVEARFAGGVDYYHNTEKKTVTVNATVAPTLAMPNLYAERMGKGVLLTWYDVPDATGYNIYKAQVSGDSYSPTQSDITVISDWTAVTATQTKKSQYGTWQWEAFESLTTDTGYYIYAIIATGANNAKSPPAFNTASPYSKGTAPALNITRQTDTKKVQVNWQADVDATYELQYAEAKNPYYEGQNATTTNFIATGTWTSVTVAAAANYPQGRAVVNVDNLTVGKNYVFRLVETNNGVKGEPSYAVLNDNEFSVTVKFQLSSVNNPTNPSTVANPNPTPVTATTIRLTLTDNGTYRGQDYTNIKLYRRETTNGALGVYTEITTLGAKSTYAKLDATNSPASSWSFDDATVDLAKTYQYKIVIGTYEIDNTSTGNDETTTPVYPAGRSNGTTYIYNNSGTYLTTGTQAGSVQLNNGGAGLESLKFTIRYNTTTGVNPNTATQEVTVTRVRNTTTNADSYYFTPSTSAVSGSPIQVIRYPWSTEDITPITLCTKP